MGLEVWKWGEPEGLGGLLTLAGPLVGLAEGLTSLRHAPAPGLDRLAIELPVPPGAHLDQSLLLHGSHYEQGV